MEHSNGNQSDRPPLRILYLEDNPADVILARDQFASEELAAEVRNVATRDEFCNALDEGRWDLVIADYKLPDYNGLEALKRVRKTFPNLPFILISGTIGEQAAVDGLKAGATDYILKQKRDRLPAAVRRAVAEAAERTRRETAEEDLRHSEKQYQLLFQGNPHPMWVFDLESLAILEVNDAATQHYGYNREEFLQMTLSDLRVPDNRPQESTTAADITAQGLVWRHRHKSGREMDMEVVWSPLAFHGKLAALTLATDVTFRRWVSQRNLVFSQLSHNLSAVTTAAEAALFICEAADELFHWDDFALDLYSVESDEVVSLLTITTVEGRRVEIPASPQPKTANALVQRVITRGAELVTAQETGDKEGTTMLAPIRKGDRVIGVLFIQRRQAHSYTGRDVETLQTLADHCGGALQRVQVEEELRQSQRRFRDLFENSPDAIFVEDLEGRVLDVNRGACLLHGLAREVLLGCNSIESLVPPARRETARAEFKKLATGQLSWVESESLRAGGRVVPVEIRAVRVDYAGQPALLFHVRDITERRASELALRSSEILFRSVWENSVDGMRLTDENGTIIAANEAFCRLVSLPHRHLEGKPLTVVYSPKLNWDEMLRQHCERFQTGVIREKLELERIMHDNRVVIFEITDSYVESDGKRRLLLSLFRDATSHRRLEEQLRQSQKMEAIGQLAGGIAHDFNNILTIILGHATLLTMAQLDAKALVSAQQIKQASERAAGLTRQLLAFGRKQIFNPRPLDLNRVVGKMTDLLARLLGEDITLRIRPSNEPAVVSADVSMLEQILLNLSVNSRDAMPRGGQLTIRIETENLDEEHTRRVAEARPGQFVRLSHEDTGEGIPPENLSRIFEPFFTTKELGKGTGLGLATVFGIVKQHEGWVEVESELGKGTAFHLYFPVSAEPAADPDQADVQFHARKGTETILVVEDERDLREIVTRTLNLNGYRVFQAVDGQNALQIWAEYKKEINLLFTDIIMPGGLNGRELADRLWAERPELKVIFSSGYGAEALGKNFKLNPKLNYLQKPYLPQTLSRVIRRCLDGDSIG